MPEGPSLVILKEETVSFTGKTIVQAEGYAKVDKSRLTGKPVVAIRTWGKHFLIQLPDLTIRVHLLMFGTYRINERKETNPFLSLQFDDGSELNFYTCSIRLIEGALDDQYDWAADIMSENWDAAAARKNCVHAPICWRVTPYWIMRIRKVLVHAAIFLSVKDIEARRSDAVFIASVARKDM